MKSWIGSSYEVFDHTFSPVQKANFHQKSLTLEPGSNLGSKALVLKNYKLKTWTKNENSKSWTKPSKN